MAMQTSNIRISEKMDHYAIAKNSRNKICIEVLTSNKTNYLCLMQYNIIFKYFTFFLLCES